MPGYNEIKDRIAKRAIITNLRFLYFIETFQFKENSIPAQQCD